MGETGKMKKKTKIFEFVEVENMIKVHDEINFFFQYFWGARGEFSFFFSLLYSFRLHVYFDSNDRMLRDVISN